MANDNITWQNDSARARNQNDPDSGVETPGDTDAADIVGRTGEEMPEVAHDSGFGEHPADNLDPATRKGVVRKSDR
jgi:hypothetical protein